MRKDTSFILNPVQPQVTIKEKVRQRIQEAVVTGSLKGGQIISQGELARQFRISRGPVREALMELERDGLVINQPFKRTMISPFGQTETEELIDVRCLLEGFAAYRIVEKKVSLAPLRSVLIAMQNLAGSEDISQLIQVEAQFHTTLIHLAQNKYLYGMWTRIYISFLRFLSAGVNYGNQYESHSQLLKSFEDKDPQHAREAIERHIKEAYQEVLDRMSQER